MLLVLRIPPPPKESALPGLQQKSNEQAVLATTFEPDEYLVLDQQRKRGTSAEESRAAH
jgi:hypothetical protein